MASRELTQEDWDQITIDRIDQVYSGKQGCMCGCLGKYWNTGKMLLKIRNILKNDDDQRAMLQDGYIVYLDNERLEDDERSYVLYLKEDQPLPTGEST